MSEKGSFRDRYHDLMMRRLKGKAARRKYASEHKGSSVWFGLGMFGLVGWSVTIPTLLFTLIGIWIDTQVQSQYSWTLMLLVLGIVLGCLNAWFWIRREEKEIRKEIDEKKDMKV